MTRADRLASLTPARWWLLLISIALLTRLAWAAAMAPRQPYTDEVHYISHARSLAEGKGYVDESGRPTAYWPVGYPALLSVFYRLGGESQAANTILQIALGIATAVILAWLGTMAFGPRIGRSAALLLAIYPNHVFYSTLNLTEPLFCFFVTASAALLLRGSRAVDRAANQVLPLASAGIALGLGALVRPVLLLFPVVLPVWFWRLRWPMSKLLSQTALVAFGTLLTVGPWVLRNHAVTGAWFTISSTGGDNFWAGNYPGSLGGYAHPRQINEQVRWGTGDDEAREYSLGLHAIAQQPARAFLRVFQKASYFFALETDGALWNLKGFRQPPLLLAVVLLGLANAAYLLVVTFAVLGIIRTPARHPLLSLFLLLTGYLVLVTIVFFGDPRYHYALLPLALIFAVKGWLDGLPWLRKPFDIKDQQRRRQLAMWGAVVGCYLLLIAVNLVLKFLEFRQYVRISGKTI